jgi:hypothetical protein
MDTARGLSSRLLRAEIDGVLKIGMCGNKEEKVNEHVHALLDLLAWHYYEVTHGKRLANRVQLVLGRGQHTASALPPLRTLCATHTGAPRIELCVESASDPGSLMKADVGEAPTFDGERPTTWVQYLDGWAGRAVEGLAKELLARSSDQDRLRLYPQLSNSPETGLWSLRLDGLQVGQVGERDGVLQVGGDGESSQKAVRAWREVTGDKKSVAVTLDTVDSAVDLIHQLVERLGATSGELLDHGVPEHALESAVVRGAIPVRIGGRELVPIGAGSDVAVGSQIPTQWAPDTGPRYLDALLRDGQVPWAVEMKVKAGGGYGSYLRHAIGQAVLYRHFLRTAPAFQTWFARHELDGQAVRAAVLYPQPPDDVQRKTAGRIGNLLLTAAAFDVQVVTVDAGWLH